MSAWDLAANASEDEVRKYSAPKPKKPAFTTPSSNKEAQRELSLSLLHSEHDLAPANPKEAKYLSKIKSVKYVTEEELVAEEVRERERQVERLNHDVVKIHEV